MDLRGLAALAGKILSVLARPESLWKNEDAALDLYGASRLFQRRGDAFRARSLCEQALEAGLPRPVDRAARRELAFAARRSGDFARAANLWEAMLQSREPGPDGRMTILCEAYEQLAIHYEHRAKEPRRAAELSREAMATVRKASQLGCVQPAERRKLLARWEHRLARLERKLRASPSAPLSL
jgi:hypothetical protein